jgi:hypothetical protein
LASKRKKAKGNEHFDWDDGKWRQDPKLPHDPAQDPRSMSLWGGPSTQIAVGVRKDVASQES